MTNEKTSVPDLSIGCLAASSDLTERQKLITLCDQTTIRQWIEGLQVRLGVWYEETFSHTAHAAVMAENLMTRFAKMLVVQRMSEYEREWMDYWLMHRTKEDLRFERNIYKPLPNELIWNELLNRIRQNSQRLKNNEHTLFSQSQSKILTKQDVQNALDSAFFHDLEPEIQQNLIDHWKQELGVRIFENLYAERM